MTLAASHPDFLVALVEDPHEVHRTFRFQPCGEFGLCVSRYLHRLFPTRLIQCFRLHIPSPLHSTLNSVVLKQEGGPQGLGTKCPHTECGVTQ